MGADQEVDGVMYVQLSSYLKRLRAFEMRKPEKDRLSVPTLKELSEVCGVHFNTISRISSGATKLLNLDIISAIMTEMWRRGFETQVTDIFRFDLPAHMKIKQIRANDPWGPLPPLPPLPPVPPPLTREQHRKYPGSEFVRAYEEESP